MRAAYNDELKAGITAVVEQCASTETTLYNNNTGHVMVCSGGTLTKPQETPVTPDIEPSSPTPIPQEHHNLPPSKDDVKDPSFT